MVNNDMSLIDFNSNDCSLISFMTQDVNQSMEGEQDCKRHLNPNEEQYHLPRSSPVICRNKKGSQPVSLAKRSGLYSLVSNTFIENKEIHLLDTERSSQLNHSLNDVYRLSSKKPQNSFPEREWVASSAQISSQCVLLDSHCALVGDLTEELCNEQATSSNGSSESDEFELIDIKEEGLENEPTTSLDTCLISSPENGMEKIAEELYKHSVEIDQENAHFVVVDMVLEVLEVAKWNVSQKYTGVSSLNCLDQGFCLNSSSDTSEQRSSAEVLAQKFMMKLGKWAIPTEELLEELPLNPISMGTGCEASLTDEILQRSRMRGAFIWTPPQFQIIYSVHPTQRRSDILASQNFLCVGCGTEVDPRHMKKLIYCNYLGKYFCDCCHAGSESVIPARVLKHWDFGRYSVCQFSNQLLVSIWEKPLFRITSVAKNLYSHAKELQKFREIQERLISIKKLLKACRLSEGVLVEFQQLPSHLSQELHLFSMDDLIRIKRGQYLATAKAVMKSAIAHVEACELCQAKGFICEFCQGPDVLFPFQTDICARCHECRSCFHASCFRDEPCPKCVRVKTRKNLKET